MMWEKDTVEHYTRIMLEEDAAAGSPLVQAARAGRARFNSVSDEVGSGEPLPGTPSRNRSSAGCKSLAPLGIAMGRRPMAISAEFGDLHPSEHPVLAPAISRDLPRSPGRNSHSEGEFFRFSLIN
jgi:hypothetical protein